jgi:hypothetical protein
LSGTEGGPVFIFCTLGPVFGDKEGADSNFHVLRSRTRYESVGYSFYVLSYRICFAQYRGSRVQFSSFALLDLFSVIKRALGPVFMF